MQQTQPVRKSGRDNAVQIIRQLLTSFRLKVGDTVHDNVVKEERFVVDFDVSRQKAVEVSHIPADKLRKLRCEQASRAPIRKKLAFRWGQICSAYWELACG